MTDQTMANQSVKGKEVYTFTIAPDDKHQYLRRPCRLRLVVDDVRDLLYTYLGSSYKYEVRPEISFPAVTQQGSGGRVHFHGIIYLSPEDKCRLYTDVLPYLSLWTRIEIDTIEDLEVWKNYIKKEEKGMRAFCKSERVMYIINDKTNYKLSQQSKKK